MVGDPGDERPERAARRPPVGVRGHGLVNPAAQVVGVGRVLEQLLLRLQCPVDLGVDDGQDQVGLVPEVVVELALAGPGGRRDVVQARTGDSTVVAGCRRPGSYVAGRSLPC